MSYNLFLDDLRYPSWIGLVDSEWVIARSFKEAVELISNNGFPQKMSFDHDLGEENDMRELPTGYDLAHWIVESHLDGDITIPSDFTFTVHSANPVGAANITALLTNYLNSMDKV